MYNIYIFLQIGSITFIYGILGTDNTENTGLELKGF